MAKTKERFPKQIFVVNENEGTDDAFLSASEFPEGLKVQDDVRTVAVYSLERVAKIVNKTVVV